MKELDGDVDPDRLYDALFMREKDISAAILEFEALAEQGSSFAMGVLGDIYLYGRHDVPMDEHKGEELTRKASQLGSIESAYRLACFFDYKRRHAEAFSLYEDLGKRGFTPALYRLGWSYSEGRWVGQDRTRARDYFVTAYKGGHLLAQQKLSFDLRHSPRLSDKLYGLYLLITLVIPRARQYHRQPLSDRLRD